ncbi:MAG: hypothetical protein ACRDP4_15160, partial [Nocardioidaceae bacterium]
MTGHARHIAIAGVALIALTTVSACGGGATDIATGGNAGHPSASTNSPSASPSPSPTETGGTAPTHSTGDSTEPATTPTSSPQPTLEPGEKVLSALSRKGFKCWLTASAAATGQAAVHTCYLEPGTGLFDDERVQVDVGDDGIDA